MLRRQPVLRMMRFAGRFWQLHHETKEHLFRSGNPVARSFHKATILLIDYGKRVLVCGDGNLSYSASIAKGMKERGAHLTATVLESQQEHERGMKKSLCFMCSQSFRCWIYRLLITKLPCSLRTLS
jgi:hypothetical protein